MLPLYHDPHFTFRFADDRIIPRIHLEGVEAGRRVSVFKIEPGTGERLGLLATATVGDGGWVDLPEPIIVRAGEAFVAVPGQSSATPPLTLLGVGGLFAVTPMHCRTCRRFTPSASRSAREGTCILTGSD
jgi:hypothetical protein